MTHLVRRGSGVLCALIALAFPAASLAATPTVTTGGAQDVTQTTATVLGHVNPNGNQTSAFFQYGTTKVYGATTPETDIGKGDTSVPFGSPIGSLAPYTIYHYRLVAHYGNKVVFGKDRTFRTRKQPLGLTLAATPSRVRANGSTTLAGTLSGTDASGQSVQLQSNPYPFAGFVDYGNPQIVDSSGNFSFPVLSVPVNTQFRVIVTNKQDIVSPIVAVVVPVQVHMKVARKVRKGKVVFKGRVTPVDTSAKVEIQRKFFGKWVTVKRTKISSSGAGSSFFKTRVKVSHSGKYRALVTPSGAYVANHSETHRIKLTH
jgi:putative transposon-encoded protein